MNARSLTHNRREGLTSRRGSEMRMKMMHLLRADSISAIAIGLALLPDKSPRSEAAAAVLFDSYACTADNSDLITTVSWAGNDQTALQQWVDTSPLHNGWQPGTFF